MPWLRDEIEGWDELSEEEREALREAVRSLGTEVYLDDEDGYFE